MRAVFILTLFTLTLKGLSQVSAGPKFQLNFSNVAGGEKDAGNKYKLGFNAGAFINIQLSDLLDFHPEMLYSTRGYKLQKSIGSKDTNITHRFSYIDFPILGIIHVGDNGFIEAGPQIGYLANDKMKGSVVSSSVVQKVDTGNVYGFNTTEYSLVVGGGYKFNFKLSAGVRFVYGLSKIYTSGQYSHNISFGISIGYYFGGASPSGRGGNVYKRI